MSELEKKWAERLAKLRGKLPNHLKGISNEELEELIHAPTALSRERMPPESPADAWLSPSNMDRTNCCKHVMRLLDYGICELREMREPSGFDWQAELQKFIPEAASLAEHYGIDSSPLLAFRPSENTCADTMRIMEIAVRRTIIAAENARSKIFETFSGGDGTGLGNSDDMPPELPVVKIDRLLKLQNTLNLLAVLLEGCKEATAKGWAKLEGDPMDHPPGGEQQYEQEYIGHLMRLITDAEELAGDSRGNATMEMVRGGLSRTWRILFGTRGNNDQRFDRLCQRRAMVLKSLAEKVRGLAVLVSEQYGGREPSATIFDNPPDRERDIPLNDRQRWVLQTLLEQKAFDSDHRMTTENIVAKVSKGADPVQYKAVVSSLVQLGYVQTKRGGGGGCWMTTEGRTRGESLIAQ